MSARIFSSRPLPWTWIRFWTATGKFIFVFVVRLKLLVQRFNGELAGFAFVQDGELRVEAEFVKMLAHELEAKTWSVPMCAMSNKASCPAQWNVAGIVRARLFLQSRDGDAGAFRSAAASVKVTMSSSSSERFFGRKQIQGSGRRVSGFCRCRRRP